MSLYGGETNLSNLLELCGHHHALVHEGGFDVTANGDGEFAFFTPDGVELPPHPPPRPPGDHEQLPRINDAAGVYIDHRTNRCRWDGGPADYGTMVESLQRRDGRLH